jgi:hypothetical protein
MRLMAENRLRWFEPRLALVENGMRPLKHRYQKHLKVELPAHF